MLITYDTEFLDDGKTIELISIGMVAEDGRRFYGINGDADFARIVDYDLQHDGFMLREVLKHLPHTGGDFDWQLDFESNFVLTRPALAVEVEHFLVDTPDPDLWAYYPATDHVAGYQLFGSMIEASRDRGWPMRTSCLKQEEVQLERRLRAQFQGNDGVFDKVWAQFQQQRPVQKPGTKHHALHDARHDMELALWLELAHRPSIAAEPDPADVR